MQESQEAININQSGIEFNNLLKNTAKEEFHIEMKQQEQKKLNQKNFNTLSKELNKTFKLNEREQNIENKQKYVYQILKYQDSMRFGDFVRKKLKINYTESSLQKKKCKDLEDILSRININLQNRNLDNFYNSMLQNATLSFEKLMEHIYTIEGFSESLMQNDHFLDCVEQYKIQNITKMPALPPSLQLIFIMSQTAMICHQVAIRKQKNSEPKLDMDPPMLTEEQNKLLGNN